MDYKTELINLLIEYKSVIGTISGTVLGFILNHFSRKGRLKIYIYDFKEKCFINMRTDKQEERETSYVTQSTNRLDCRFSIDIYNNSSDTKIMREINLVFCCKDKDDYLITPYDSCKTTMTGTLASFREVTPINISPKGVIKLNLVRDININNYDVTKVRKIYFQYKNNKNRTKKVLVKKFKVK